jgi:hypothetical protein
MLRDLLTHNPWQKFFSLLLAGLIWFTVRYGIGQDPRGDESTGNYRTFKGLPITVLMTASDLGRYQVSPATVNVTLKGDPATLDRLQSSELEVYVNLIDHSPPHMTRRIHVNVPAGVQISDLQPRDVQIERLVNPATGR